MGVNKTTVADAGSKVLIAIGAAVVVALIIWGGITIARALPGAFSNLGAVAVTLTSIFTPADENVSLTVRSTVVDVSTPFTLSWVHTDKSGEGKYHLSYGCRDGVSLEIAREDGTYALKECGSPFVLPADTGNEAKLIALSENNRFIDVPITLAYTTENNTVLTDEVTITIVNKEIANSRSGIEEGSQEEDESSQESGGRGTTAGEETTETFEIPAGGTGVFVSDPSGRVDLAVTILEVGIVNQTTGEFTGKDSVSVTDRVGVRFRVENLGTKTSPQWKFRAVLPTERIEFFDSPTQRVLEPGDRIKYTLGFDGIRTGDDVVFTVNVDPDNQIGEVSESNNIAKRTLVVLSE